MLLSWKAKEYKYRQKSTDWFWAVGLIGTGGAVTAIILGDLLFAIFIIVATVAAFIQSIRKPRTLEYGIEKRGIKIHKTFYPFSTLESFWVTDDDEPKLLIKSQKFFSPYIILPLENTDSDEVRDMLLEVLDEEEHAEPFIDRIMEYLGF